LFAGCIVAVKADTGRIRLGTIRRGIDTENFHIVRRPTWLSPVRSGTSSMTVPEKWDVFVIDA